MLIFIIVMTIVHFMCIIIGLAYGQEKKFKDVDVISLMLAMIFFTWGAILIVLHYAHKYNF